MIRAYGAVRTVRLIFTSRHEVQSAHLEVNQALYKGNIWTY